MLLTTFKAKLNELRAEGLDMAGMFHSLTKTNFFFVQSATISYFSTLLNLFLYMLLVWRGLRTLPVFVLKILISVFCRKLWNEWFRISSYILPLYQAFCSFCLSMDFFQISLAIFFTLVLYDSWVLELLVTWSSPFFDFTYLYRKEFVKIDPDCIEIHHFMMILLKYARNHVS